MLVGPTPGTPWECATLDGTAFFDASTATWHLVFQCLARGARQQGRGSAGIRAFLAPAIAASSGCGCRGRASARSSPANMTPAADYLLGTKKSMDLFFYALIFLYNTIIATPVLAQEGSFDKLNYVRLSGTGCNTASFAQIPGERDLFLGRQPIAASSINDCSSSRWEIVLDRLDWEAHAFTLLHPILTPPLSIEAGAARITTAYDPYVVWFNGEYWIAFECAGDGIPGASTCMGPLKDDKSTIDPVRTSVVIAGNHPDQLSDQYSASDPKLLVYQGNLYLYWTAIHMKDNKWVSLATRGAELKQERGPLRRFWPVGANQSTPSFDPSANQEVWSGADMFSAMERDGRIFATAGATRGSCVSPNIDEPDCYRLIITEADAPLGVDIFARHMAASNRLPSNPQDYARFATGPDGRLVIIDHIYSPGTSTSRASLAPDGLVAYPVDLKQLFAK